MKIGVTLTIALIASAASTALLWNASSCLAQEEEQTGAKGLYFQQLDKPAASINTGLRYWVELNRNGKTTRVSNKATFFSGDHIRFHVCPNIDGYAYVLLRSGSRGEQSVLFPDEKMGEDNHVQHGHDYELPSDGYLTFDKNPGTERLTLLLSRKPIDAMTFLAKPNVEPTLIASTVSGSKDLIPAQVSIVYSPTDTKPGHAESSLVPPSAKAPDTRKKIGTTTTATTSKSPSENVQTATVVLAHSGQHGAAKPVAHVVSHSAYAPEAVTVVKKDPNGILFIDISFEHQ